MAMVFSKNEIVRSGIFCDLSALCEFHAFEGEPAMSTRRITEDDVAKTYMVLLGRPAWPHEMDDWSDRASSYADLYSGIAGSPEYLERAARRRARQRKFIPLIGGGALLTLSLVAGQLLARHLGTSNFIEHMIVVLLYPPPIAAIVGLTYVAYTLFLREVIKRIPL